MKKTIGAEERIKEKIAIYAKPLPTGLPFEWNMNSAPGASGTSDQDLKAILQERLGAESKIVKLIIQPTLHRNWIIENNDNGSPKRKYHHQMLFIFKEENGRFHFYEGYLQQPYNGGTYGKIQFNLLRSGEYVNSKPFKQALKEKKE